MSSIPIYFIVLAGISLHILHHQSKHIREVWSGRAMLNPVIVGFMSVIMYMTLLALLGLSVYFGVKFGWLAALKFVGLSILVQFPVAIVVGVLGLHRFAWAISLAGIVLLPVLTGIMFYASFHR
jgi:hypothetical protein